MTHSTSPLRARIARKPVTRLLAGLVLAGAFVAGASVIAAPAGALGTTAPSVCRPLTDGKARVHAAATRREATLARLVATLQARRDPWSLNGGQISALQSANAGISALDDHIQSACYATADALRTEATALLTDYRVYWLRVPQTHEIEAADRLAEARARLGDIATRLSGHVTGNVRAQTDLAAMNQALAAADTALGTVPTPSANLAQVPGLAPAADMAADVAVMEAARGDLLSARASLVTARAAGRSVLVDLGA